MAQAQHPDVMGWMWSEGEHGGYATANTLPQLTPRSPQQVISTHLLGSVHCPIRLIPGVTLESINPPMNGSPKAPGSRQKATTSLLLSQSMGSLGYLNINGMRTNYWERAGHDDSYGVSYGVGFSDISLTLSLTHNKQYNNAGNSVQIH